MTTAKTIAFNVRVLAEKATVQKVYNDQAFFDELFNVGYDISAYGKDNCPVSRPCSDRVEDYAEYDAAMAPATRLHEELNTIWHSSRCMNKECLPLVLNMFADRIESRLVM